MELPPKRSPFDAPNDKILTRILTMVAEDSYQRPDFDDLHSNIRGFKWREQQPTSPTPMQGVRNSATVCKRWFEAVQKNRDLWFLALSMEIDCENKQSLQKACEEFDFLKHTLSQPRNEDCQLYLSIRSGIVKGTKPEPSVYADTAILYLNLVQYLMKYKDRIVILELQAFSDHMCSHVSYFAPEMLSFAKLEFLSLSVCPITLPHGSDFTTNSKFAPFKSVEDLTCEAVTLGPNLRDLDLGNITWPTNIKIDPNTSLKQLRFRNAIEREGDWALLTTLLRNSTSLSKVLLGVSDIGGLPSSLPPQPTELGSINFLKLDGEPTPFSALMGSFSFLNLERLTLDILEGPPIIPDSYIVENKRIIFPSVKKFSYTSRSEEGAELLANFSFPAIEQLELVDDSWYDDFTGDRVMFPLPFGIELAPSHLVFICLDMTTAVYHLAKVKPTRLESAVFISTEDIYCQAPLLEAHEVPHWADHSGATHPSLPTLKDVTFVNCPWGKGASWIEAGYFDFPKLETITFDRFPPEFKVHLAKDEIIDADECLRFEKIALQRSVTGKNSTIEEEFEGRYFHNVKEVSIFVTPDTRSSAVTEREVAHFVTQVMEKLSTTKGSPNMYRTTDENTITYFPSATFIVFKCNGLDEVGPECLSQMKEGARRMGDQRAARGSPTPEVTFACSAAQTKHL